MDSNPSAADISNESGLPSENDRLITALQSCFSDLVKNQQEQARRQDEQAEKLQQAVEALKPKVPVTDRKTAFWNAYKTLADEHDGEFQRKYSTDLDTTLIFAGLFSAVDSAFIIQIQSEIQLQDTPILILIAQNLLYISLFSTLLAALLAVLGKQWLMYYLAAGERGSLEARGLERQRKFDGLRRWKFDTLMQAFPLLLQAGLLLFSTALSIYLRTIHKSLAIVALFFTAFGFVSYTGLLISAVAAPDSPFQIPLAALVTRLIPTTLWKKLKRMSSPLLALPRRITGHLSATFTPYISRSPILLPLFQKGELNEKNGSTPDEPTPIFDAPLPEPSPEASAVSWVLEASTDPRVINLAAAMVAHLQWPSTMDARLHLSRLRDGLLACFHFVAYDSTPILRQLEDGMALQALHLGHAYCALRWTFRLGDPEHPHFSYAHPYIDELSPELANVVRNLAGEPAVLFGVGQESDTRWSLRVIPSNFYADSTSRYKDLERFLAQFDDEIPSLDVQSFTDYLFCILSFLSSISPHDVARMDKRQFQKKLVERIVAALLASLQTNQISMDTATKVIDTTNRLARNDITRNVWTHQALNRQPAIFRFCSSLPRTEGWVGVVLAACLLSKPFAAWDQHYNGDPGWIYETLQCFQTFMDNQDWVSMNADRVAGLFNALLHHDAPPAKEHMHLLLQALSLPGLISRHSAQLFFQDNIKNWFLDEELQHTLQEGSLWMSLMRVFPGFPFLGDGLIALGHILASIPAWVPFIQEKPSAWIMLFFYQNDMRGPRWKEVEKYNFVLSRLWNPDVGKYDFTEEGERALGLAVVTLSKLWQEIDLAGPSLWHELVELLRCTNWTVVRDYYHRDPGETGIYTVQITPRFIAAFSQCLYDSLAGATVAIRSLAGITGNSAPEASVESFPGKQDTLERAAKILENMANEMPYSVGKKKEHTSPLDDLREQFNEEINALEKSLL